MTRRISWWCLAVFLFGCSPSTGGKADAVAQPSDAPTSTQDADAVAGTDAIAADAVAPDGAADADAEDTTPDDGPLTDALGPVDATAADSGPADASPADAAGDVGTAPGPQVAPAPPYWFVVAIDGQEVGPFGALEDVGFAIDYAEVSLPDDPILRKKTDGTSTSGAFTLSAGVAPSSAVSLWIEDAYLLPTGVARKDVTIRVLTGNAFDENLRLEYQDCFPSAWKVGPLYQDQVIIESLRLECDALDIIGPT